MPTTATSCAGHAKAAYPGWWGVLSLQRNPYARGINGNVAIHALRGATTLACHSAPDAKNTAIGPSPTLQAPRSAALPPTPVQPPLSASAPAAATLTADTDVEVIARLAMQQMGKEYGSKQAGLVDRLRGEMYDNAAAFCELREDLLPSLAQQWATPHRLLASMHRIALAAAAPPPLPQPPPGLPKAESAAPPPARRQGDALAGGAASVLDEGAAAAAAAFQPPDGDEVVGHRTGTDGGAADGEVGVRSETAKPLTTAPEVRPVGHVQAIASAIGSGSTASATAARPGGVFLGGGGSEVKEFELPAWSGKDPEVEDEAWDEGSWPPQEEEEEKEANSEKEEEEEEDQARGAFAEGAGCGDDGGGGGAAATAPAATGRRRLAAGAEEEEEEGKEVEADIRQLTIMERRCPDKFRSGYGSGRLVRLTCRQRREPYALKESETPPALAAELREFELFCLYGSFTGAQVGEPLRPTTCQGYLQCARQALGWLHRVEGVPLEELRLGLLVPGAQRGAARRVHAFLQWQERERGAATSSVARSLLALLQLAKFLFHEVSQVKEGEKPYSDVEVIKSLRAMYMSYERVNRVSGHVVEVGAKWLDWPEYLAYVEELRRECAGLQSDGRPRSPVDVAMSLQAYLLAAILSCVPDRQRTLRELVVGRTLIKDKNGIWSIRHSHADYKTGGTYGERPPLVIDPGLYYELEEFIYTWRAHLKPQHNFLFSKRDGSAPLTAQELSRSFSLNAFRLTGRKLNPHMVRDMVVTYARSGHANEHELEALAIYMGHSMAEQRGTYDRRTKAEKVQPAMGLLAKISGAVAGGGAVGVAGAGAAAGTAGTGAGAVAAPQQVAAAQGLIGSGTATQQMRPAIAPASQQRKIPGKATIADESGLAASARAPALDATAALVSPTGGGRFGERVAGSDTGPAAQAPAIDGAALSQASARCERPRRQAQELKWAR